MNWLITAVVVAVSAALIMTFAKFLKKRAASGPIDLTWTPKQSSLFIMVALLPLAAIVAAIWYFSVNFHSIAGVSGLVKGVLIAWLLYTACMLVAHAALWRTDLF